MKLGQQAARATKLYFHFDGLGSTWALTAENENVTDDYAHTSTGVTVSATSTNGPSVNPSRFGGQCGVYDDGSMGSSSGLSFASSFYYAAATGRAMSLAYSRNPSCAIGTTPSQIVGADPKIRDCPVGEPGNPSGCYSYCVDLGRSDFPQSNFLADCEECCGALYPFDPTKCIASFCYVPTKNRTMCKCPKKLTLFSRAIRTVQFLVVVLAIVAVSVSCHSRGQSVSNGTTNAPNRIYSEAERLSGKYYKEVVKPLADEARRVCAKVMSSRKVDADAFSFIERTRSRQDESERYFIASVLDAAVRVDRRNWEWARRICDEEYSKAKNPNMKETWVGFRDGMLRNDVGKGK
jgi:hypothetical protein